MATIDFQDAVADPTLVENFDPSNDILNFQNATATEVTVGRGNGETTFTTAAGSVTLPIDLAEVVAGATNPNVTFADNSVLFVGDNSSSTNFDDLAQSIAYTTAAHQIFGLGGNDTITVKTSQTLGVEVYGNTGSDSISGATGADTLFGGAGNDSISGLTGSDLIYGNNGADTIRDGSGNDSLFGGQGADSIVAATGSDLVYGNKGADTINATANSSDVAIYGNQGADSLASGSGNDSLFGGTGDDTLTLGAGGNNLAYGNQGSDTISDGSGSDTIFGGQGADSILSGTGNDLIDGKKGDDTIQVTSGTNTVFGGAGADSLVGGSGTDQINGDGGDDVILDGTGSATITGGTGADSIKMSAADGSTDLVSAGAGADTVSNLTTAGTKTDQVSMGDGDDVFILGTGAYSTAQITGNAGNDTLVATAAATHVLNNQFAQFEDIKVSNTGGGTVTIDASGQGGTGYNVFIGDDDGGSSLKYTGTNNGDTVTGGTAADTILAGSGDDSLDGGDSADTILGGSGNDTIDGGTGADSLLGQTGDDEISGGAGSDTITGGKGEDTLTGGADNDDFFVGNAGTFDAVDTISDFNAAGTGDQLFVDAEFTTATGTTTLLTKGGSFKTTSPAAKVTLTAPQLFTGSSLADLQGAITNETGSFATTTFKALGYDTGNSVLYQFTVKASSAGTASATISIAGTSTIANVGNLTAGDIVLF